MCVVNTLSWRPLRSDEASICPGSIARGLKPCALYFWEICQCEELKQRLQGQQASHLPKNSAKLENGCNILRLRVQSKLFFSGPHSSLTKGPYWIR